MCTPVLQVPSSSQPRSNYLSQWQTQAGLRLTPISSEIFVRVFFIIYFKEEQASDGLDKPASDVLEEQASYVLEEQPSDVL